MIETGKTRYERIVILRYANVYRSTGSPDGYTFGIYNTMADAVATRLNTCLCTVPFVVVGREGDGQ